MQLKQSYIILTCNNPEQKLTFQKTRVEPSKDWRKAKFEAKKSNT